MKALFLAVGLFAVLGEVEAEPAFNALSADDPHYAAYQVSLCQAVYAEYRQFYSDRYWLDHLDPNFSGMSPERREAFVLDYVASTGLRDQALQSFNANCR
jgi:hypothetical protein